MPKVSIIVPTYNVEQYLVECIESIINQTLEDIEIICVDDGSTDNSGKILDEYALKDNRIKVIHKENGGYGKAMNVGMDNSTGEYIGIVEPDDYIKSEMYEKLYKKAIEHNLDFIKSDFYRFTGSGDSIELFYNKLDELEQYNNQCYNKVLNPQEDIRLFKLLMNTWSGIYKKEFLDKYSIRHNETPGASFQDNGFWFQTFALAERVYFLDTPFYMNRRDNANSSVKRKDKVYCIRDEYNFILDFLNKNIQLKPKLITMYQYQKFNNYWATYNRIDDSFKKEFLEVFSQEFRIANKNGEIDLTLFEKPKLKKFRQIIANPNLFYIKRMFFDNFKKNIKRLFKWKK